MGHPAGGGGTARCPLVRRRSAGQLRRALGGDNQEVRKLLGEGRGNGGGAFYVAGVGSGGRVLTGAAERAQDIAGRKWGAPVRYRLLCKRHVHNARFVLAAVCVAPGREDDTQSATIRW
ncbi:hypothetical protein ATM17_14240 [Sphingopyxis macrogoltabida]|uniref:Uncharacterized protein n=1 Tax=Sphingopyxis macrogoltabida TaxID=33050 RepID=A0A0N9V065_SPHMC|nr:hypothetical protein AN936_13050 [Sphingopyxis macrogoltabida]AMU90190.1 hypothetical protein ATM17_14240 [Sphingopyxis macrogoltabida]